MYYVLCLRIIHVIECIHASKWGKLFCVLYNLYWFVSVSCIQHSHAAQLDWMERVFRNGILRAAMACRGDKKTSFLVLSAWMCQWPLVAVCMLIRVLILAALVISDDNSSSSSAQLLFEDSVFCDMPPSDMSQNTRTKIQFTKHNSVQNSYLTNHKYDIYKLYEISFVKKFPQIVTHHIKKTHWLLNLENNW